MQVSQLIDCVGFLSDLLRRQEELRRMEEVHSQEMQKRKEMQIRCLSIRIQFGCQLGQMWFIRASSHKHLNFFPIYF